jgi:hypothetical protein
MFESDTQCKRSIAYLLLAKTYSTQSTNCRLLLIMINFRTIEVYHCLRLVYRVHVKRIQMCLKHIRNAKKHCTQRHTVHSPQIVISLINDWHHGYDYLRLVYRVHVKRNQVCLKQTRNAKKHCTLTTGRDIQCTVHKLSFAPENDWHQDQKRRITFCVWCIVKVLSVFKYISCRYAMQRSIAHLLLAET